MGPGEALVEGEKSRGDVSSATLQPSHRSLGGARHDGKRAQLQDCKPDEAIPRQETTADPALNGGFLSKTGAEQITISHLVIFIKTYL